MNKERLLNVARALRESPAPDQFRMSRFFNSCGTPACAWGHYCSRTDLQSEFVIPRDTLSVGPALPKTTDGWAAGMSSGFIEIHLDISEDEMIELFDSDGCGGAKTAIEAAEYIEDFVARGGK